MGVFDFLKNKDETVKVSGYKMVTERGEGFYAYNGNLYASDIVRSCIRPKTCLLYTSDAADDSPPV